MLCAWRWSSSRHGWRKGPTCGPLPTWTAGLGDLSRKLDQNSAAARNLPQFGELERRIAELDHRLGEAMRLQGDQKAVTALRAAYRRRQ